MPVLLSWILTSCVTETVERNLHANALKQEEEFKNLMGQIRSESRKPMTWEAAHQRLMSRNLALRQSQLQREEAEKQAKRQWLSLIPKVAGFLSLGSNISTLTDVGGDNLSSSLIANFNIPSPFEFYASLYSVELQAQNARWSCELDKRRAYAQLYSFFLEAEMIRKAEVSLARRLKSGPEGDVGAIAKSFKAIAVEQRALARRQLFHRNNVNQLLNTPGENWDLIGKIPMISYQDRYNSIKIGEDFGKLALNLYAIQIEGAMLRVERIKFQQWPTINFGFNSPPLYSNTGDYGFNSDDLALFSGSNKSVDLTDIGGREGIRDAEKRLTFTREQLRQRMEFDILRILQLASSYQFLIKEESRLQREIGRMTESASSEPTIILKDLSLKSQLELQLSEIRQQIQQLDLQFLIWDEKFWRT